MSKRRTVVFQSTVVREQVPNREGGAGDWCMCDTSTSAYSAQRKFARRGDVAFSRPFFRHGNKSAARMPNGQSLPQGWSAVPPPSTTTPPISLSIPALATSPPPESESGGGVQTQLCHLWHKLMYKQNNMQHTIYRFSSSRPRLTNSDTLPSRRTLTSPGSRSTRGTQS